MIGWLAWVGSALVLLSIVLDDRRALRAVNLVAAVMMLTISLTVGPPSLLILDVALVALAVHHALLPRREPTPMVRIATSDTAQRSSMIHAA